MTERKEARLPREIGGVREIIASPTGWSFDAVHILLNPSPPEKAMDDSLSRARQRTATERVEKIQAQGGTPDKNRPKVWLRSVTEQDGQLSLTTGIVDYFTLWGLPGADSNLHKRFLHELPERRATEVPNGISTHNIVQTVDDKIILTVRSRDVGFSAGRLSVSFEEQMEPEDRHPFYTAVRGLEEEFNVNISKDAVTLLGLGAEKGSAYTSACFVTKTDVRAFDIARLWESALDKTEGSALLAVPTNDIALFGGNEITPEVWSRFVVAGTIPDGLVLQTHPTVPWRVQLLQEHARR